MLKIKEIISGIYFNWQDIRILFEKQLNSSEYAIENETVYLSCLNELAKEGYVELQDIDGKPKCRLKYEEIHKTYNNTSDLYEDVVWKEVRGLLGNITANGKRILEYGFTEIFNNAIDHSESATITVKLWLAKSRTEVFIIDNGVGIFNKIKQTFNLEDERHAIFELTKGKLTSDPQNHSGEGIFFTSRALDEFHIFSGGLCFTHLGKSDKDYLLANKKRMKGTMVHMGILNDTERSLTDVFDQFSGVDDGFTKTVIPICLAESEGESLISRSQAKRILARCEKFKEIVLDFNGINTIGQGFADQIFRIFKRDNPDIKIVVINASIDIKKMIAHVTANIEE